MSVPHQPFNQNLNTDNAFLRMLYNDEAREIFMAKLVKEASEENLLFWEAVQEYQVNANKIYVSILYNDKLKGSKSEKSEKLSLDKLTPASAKKVLVRQVREIFDTYLSKDSTYEINLNEKIISSILECIHGKVAIDFSAPTSNDPFSNPTQINVPPSVSTTSLPSSSRSSISSHNFDSLLQLVNSMESQTSPSMPSTPFSIDSQQFSKLTFEQQISKNDSSGDDTSSCVSLVIDRVDENFPIQKKSGSSEKLSSEPDLSRTTASVSRSLSLSRSSKISVKRSSLSACSEQQTRISNVSARDQLNQWNSLQQTSQVFDLAQRHIVGLMERDSFTRFRLSPEYQQVKAILEREEEMKLQKNIQDKTRRKSGFLKMGRAKSISRRNKPKVKPTEVCVN